MQYAELTARVVQAGLGVITSPEDIGDDSGGTAGDSPTGEAKGALGTIVSGPDPPGAATSAQHRWKYPEDRHFRRA